MFSLGTLVNVPHFRGKSLLVVSSGPENTRCLWTSDNGEMGEVVIPTSLLKEVQPAPASGSPPGPATRPNLDETLPSDWLRKAASGLSLEG